LADEVISEKQTVKRFPVKLESTFSQAIDDCVFYTKSPSKHQYILDAIREKVDRDKDDIMKKAQ
jgi:hypothetical protein